MGDGQTGVEWDEGSGMGRGEWNGTRGVEWDEGSRLIPNQKTGEKIWLFDLG